MANYWVLSDFGAKQLAESLRNATLSNYLNSLFLRLYINNHVPVHGDGNGAFTKATFTGYADQATTAWGAAATNGSPPNADITDTTHTFTATDGVSANTIYGVLLLDAAGNWIAGQYTNLASPAVLDAAGKSYQFQPRLTVAPYAGYP